MNNPSSEVHPLAPFLPDGARVLMLGQLSAQARALVDGILLPQSSKRHVADHGAALFRRQGPFPGRSQAFRPRTHPWLFAGRSGWRSTIRPAKSSAFGTTPRTTSCKSCDRPTWCGLLDRLPECRAVVTTGEKATETLVGQLRCQRPAVGGSAPFEYAGRRMQLFRMPSVVARLSPVRGMEGGVLPEDVRCGRYDLTFCLRFRLGCSVRVKQIGNNLLLRPTFRIFDFVEDTPARQCSNKFDITLVYSYLCYPEIGLNKTYFALYIVYFIA